MRYTERYTDLPDTRPCFACRRPMDEEPGPLDPEATVENYPHDQIPAHKGRCFGILMAAADAHAEGDRAGRAAALSLRETCEPGAPVEEREYCLVHDLERVVSCWVGACRRHARNELGRTAQPTDGLPLRREDTRPYREQAWALLDELEALARRSRPR
jgi:hypothetical protein